MKKSVLGLMVCVATFLLGTVASAQSLPFQGFAIDKFPACLIAVANDGTLDYGLGCSGSVGSLWYRDAASGWYPYEGTMFKQVSVSGEAGPGP